MVVGFVAVVVFDLVQMQMVDSVTDLVWSGRFAGRFGGSVLFVASLLSGAAVLFVVSEPFSVCLLYLPFSSMCLTV